MHSVGTDRQLQSNGVGCVGSLMYGRVKVDEISAASENPSIVPIAKPKRVSRDAIMFSQLRGDADRVKITEVFWNGLCEGRHDRALFLLEPDGLILRSNEQAQRLISSGEFISVIRGYLTCNDAKEQQKFRSIREACADGSRASGALRLDGQLVMTLDCVSPQVEPRQLILVVIYETPEFKNETMELWRELFKLAPAEARVAEFMRRGLDDATICNLLGISLHTVRGYVKSVHFKTDTKTRAEVAYLLSRIDVFRS